MHSAFCHRMSKGIGLFNFSQPVQMHRYKSCNLYLLNVFPYHLVHTVQYVVCHGLF